ncbi:MAG: M48 family metalloprotease, partial [Ottowia sp.]|nr:M48 family metalloprotease [Ottowia sp.]
MKLTHWLAVAATAALVTACASTTQGGAVGVGRNQILIVSEAQMNQQAALAYAQTLQKASSTRTLNTNAAQTARVKTIASRLIAQTGHFRPDALRWDWQVNVIQEKTINAWCMPGGKIAVYSGIIDTLKLTDDELAAVIGHEISHA